MQHHDCAPETLTDALRDVASRNIDHLASKQDLALVAQNLEATEERLFDKIDRVDERIGTLTDKVDGRLDQADGLRSAMIEKYEGRLRELEHRLTIRLGGMMVVGLGVIVALQQLLGS